VAPNADENIFHFVLQNQIKANVRLQF